MELSVRECKIFSATVIITVEELIERAEREGKADVADWLRYFLKKD